MAGPAEGTLTYTNKIILAPMVRIGTLPTRLLSLDYGADIVYSEEIIDHKLLQCERVENELLGTVDYVMICGDVVFRTCVKERGKIVLQMGTSDPDRALKVAKFMEKDIAAVDINMGCPKEFSIKGGMGAALLTQPDKIYKILTTLVKGLSIPVTCKIRILPELEDTLKLVKMIETTGVAALGVHGRLKDERPRDKNHDDVIRTIVDHISIPVIANGGSQDTIMKYDDIATFKESTNTSSVMIARAAQWNTSVFRKEGLLPIDDVIKAYLKYCIDYDSPVGNVKYNVQQTMRDVMETERGQRLMGASNLSEICDIFDLGDYLNQVEGKRQQRKRQLAEANGCAVEENVLKKRKLDDGSEIIEMPVKITSKQMRKGMSPKVIIHQYTRDNYLPPPKFNTISRPVDRFYMSTVMVDGKKYATTIWSASKRWVEQSTAVVCLRALGQDDGLQDTYSLNGSGQNETKVDDAKTDCDKIKTEVQAPLGEIENCKKPGTVEDTSVLGLEGENGGVSATKECTEITRDVS